MIENLVLLGVFGGILMSVGQLWESHKQLKQMERQIDLRLDALKAAQEFQENILKELANLAEKRKNNE